MLLWLAGALRAAGLPVREHPGWQHRGRPGVDPRVIVVHHTAAPGAREDAALGWIVDGSPIAPLANLHLSRTTGVWTVVAAGKSNNAGSGGWPPAGASSNYHTIGIEAEHSGDPADPWPCYRSYVTGVAALCRHLGWDASRVVGHKEWSPGRKVDPTFDMDQFRRDVDGQLGDDMVPPLVVYARRGVDFDSASAVCNAAGAGTATLDRDWAQWCVSRTKVVAVGGGSAKDLDGEVEAVGPDGLASLIAAAGKVG